MRPAESTPRSSMRMRLTSIHIHKSLTIVPVVIFLLCYPLATRAHPLGNFTINHYARIEISSEKIGVRYVIDMAEIPTFQELQAMTANTEGQPSQAQLNAYAVQNAARYAEGLVVFVDGVRLPLKVISSRIGLQAGVGGLQTMRIECDLMGGSSETTNNQVGRLLFEDRNYGERIGWREIVVLSFSPVSVFNSSAYGSGVTDELRSYPRELLAAPLDERRAEFSFTTGPVPAGSHALRARTGQAATSMARDRLAELIAVPTLSPSVVLLGLLLAVLLGGLHAMSPGHGKTIVGAYLIGSRGTARHAAFLGLTVTITHTAGVFALGLITLWASEYVVPERLFPLLSLVSGAIVICIGISLFFRRLRFALGLHAHNHNHQLGDESHTHSPERDADPFDHDRVSAPNGLYTHGGRMHSHLPPGSDGSPVTWRSLLALGISGGILPCPSALVVLLAAISLHRVGYGLLLVIAFSVGLAGVLTAVGLAFVYARRLVRSTERLARLTRVLPVFSSLVITCAGAAICYSALDQAGLNLSNLVAQLRVQGANLQGASLLSAGAFGVLALGLLYGLKHATEVDHIVAVSAIVSEHQKLTRAAIVGAMWGAGHTASLLVVGAVVLALRVVIPEHVASWLEFCVALMIITLGMAALRRGLRSRSDFHVHKHSHGGLSHAHVHFHGHDSQHSDRSAPHSHAITRVGLKPVIVGAVHGLAGSAALTLLVLTQINSSLLGLLYLSVFGIGSIIGMLVMSGLVGLPFALSSKKLIGIHYGLQMLAGIVSIAFGIWYAYATGVVVR